MNGADNSVFIRDQAGCPRLVGKQLGERELIIARMQVEEGFLDGLDLEFKPGLNVLIGPRGVGKSAIIELMRFCLAVPGVTEDSTRSARDIALAVLGRGQVTLTLQLGGGVITVTRSAEEKAPRASADYPTPLIFSQMEIEKVSLSATGRLGIIDGFLGGDRDSSGSERNLAAQIRSQTVELQSIAEEIHSVDDQIADLGDVAGALKEAEEQQAQLLKTGKKTQEQQGRLAVLNTTVAEARVQDDVLKRSASRLADWIGAIQGATTLPSPIVKWPDAAGSEDRLKAARAAFSEAVIKLEQALAGFRAAMQLVEEAQKRNETERLAAEEEARDLRRTLEEVTKGAGAAARLVAEMREKVSTESALRARKDDELRRRGAVLSRRAKMLEELDGVRLDLFSRRLRIAERLNSELGPRIGLKVSHGGLHPEYEASIRNALVGSRLHYNELAPLLAERLSPRELVEAVEVGAADELAGLAGIDKNRAQRIVSEIAKAGAEDVLTAPISELVTLSLLDGSEYKTTDVLSVGQRCTVILPILLARHDRTLVIDQPEDNLDNAFIVDTIVGAIRSREPSEQLIFATHNPNIPVLGEAEWVVFLGSDGRRGFVQHAKPLNDELSVKAITSVMEGGRQAFLRRAEFYHQRLNSDAES